MLRREVWRNSTTKEIEFPLRQYEKRRRQKSTPFIYFLNYPTFVDGNERIGMYIMLTFLDVNGVKIDCTNEELVEVGLSVAAGTMDYEELRDWVINHKV